jgi:hypothetical protein
MLNVNGRIRRYTAMIERLDPEEIKEIMNIISGKIAKIIKSYDGFIE